MNQKTWQDIVLQMFMRLTSPETLIIVVVAGLCYGTEHIQLAVGGLLGFLTKEAVDILKK